MKKCIDRKTSRDKNMYDTVIIKYKYKKPKIIIYKTIVHKQNNF